MPTYRNDTDKRITHADKTYVAWQPGEAKRLPYFVPHREMGLTLADPEPYVRRKTSLYLYRELILNVGDEPTVLDLPYHEEFELSVACPRGVVLMRIGDGEEVLVLDGDNQHASRYAWDMTAYLTFAADAASPEGTAYVLVKMEASRFKGA